MLLSFNASVFLSSDIESSDGDSSSEGDDMPWQQMWLSSDSDLDYEALRKENNWLVSLSCFFFPWQLRVFAMSYKNGNTLQIIMPPL